MSLMLRPTSSLPIGLLIALPCLAQAQPNLAWLLTAAEISYPAAKVPALFADGSQSSGFAAEAKDPEWAPDMESRILAEVAKEQEQGLLFRDVDVECRSSTCAILLVHAMSNGSAGSTQDLSRSLRETLGFVGTNISTKWIMVPSRDPRQPASATSTTVPITDDDRMVRSTAVAAFVEIVVRATRDPAAGP